ncbi:MAG: hypothetical protein JWP36_1627 [Paucimonas sp.]|nr:hypothetical protein [Paucimonas sp.]
MNPSQPDSAVILDTKDLPAFCPNKAMPVWSTHPRVYLDMAENNEARCPYCSTVYRLAPGAKAHGH